MVVEADVERRLLLAESAELAAKAEAKEYAPGAGEEKRRLDVEDALIQMDAAGAPGRASALLHNLGFPEALMDRPMRALSGGWRVRAALAAAAASPSTLPVEPETVLDASPEVMSSITSTDDMEEQETENLSDDDEADTGLLDPTIDDDEDLDLDILGIEEDAPLEESAAEQSVGAGEPADMIGEAEIYIAYGRVGQAVNLLSGVLEKEPERHDVRLKLLEVFVRE